MSGAFAISLHFSVLDLLLQIPRLVSALDLPFQQALLQERFGLLRLGLAASHCDEREKKLQIVYCSLQIEQSIGLCADLRVKSASSRTARTAVLGLKRERRTRAMSSPNLPDGLPRPSPSDPGDIEIPPILDPEVEELWSSRALLLVSELDRTRAALLTDRELCAGPVLADLVLLGVLLPQSQENQERARDYRRLVRG